MPAEHLVHDELPYGRSKPGGQLHKRDTNAQSVDLAVDGCRVQIVIASRPADALCISLVRLGALLALVDSAQTVRERWALDAAEDRRIGASRAVHEAKLTGATPKKGEDIRVAVRVDVRGH